MHSIIMIGDMMSTPTHATENTPGTVVLQWLTYVFWGWTIGAIAYLVGVITYYVMNGSVASGTAEPVAYGIAAAAILLPIALVCDWLYSKREPVHKHGFASIVMVVHAVIFALLAIGALITAAFSGVSLLLTTGDTTASVVTIAVSIALVVLLVKLLARTARPLLFKKFRLLFRISMSAVVLAALIWGAVGPVTQAVVTKDDRAVRDSLLDLTNVINQYTYNNNALPDSIAAAVADEQSSSYTYTSKSTIADLAARSRIAYMPNIKPADTSPDGGISIDVPVSSGETTTYYYQLCGVYAHDLGPKDQYYSPSYPITAESSEYRVGVDTGPVKAGTQCYKLTTTSYKN
jgi:hypothetical protein